MTATWQDNPKFFPKSNDSDISLENIFKALDTGVSYKSSYDRFYSSANQIIDLFNQRSFSQSVKDAGSLLALKDQVIERGDINEINRHSEQIKRIHSVMRSFMEDAYYADPNSDTGKAVKESLILKDNLSATFAEYRQMIDDINERSESEDSITKNKTVDFDPLSYISTSDALLDDELIYDYNNESNAYNSAIDKSFSSGRSYVSDYFTNDQKDVINATSQVGNIVNQLDVIDKSIPSLSSRSQKRKLIRQLREKSSTNIPPRIKASIQLLMYKYEVEGF